MGCRAKNKYPITYTDADNPKEISRLLTKAFLGFWLDQAAMVREMMNPPMIRIRIENRSVCPSEGATERRVNAMAAANTITLNDILINRLMIRKYNRLGMNNLRGKYR